MKTVNRSILWVALLLSCIAAPLQAQHHTTADKASAATSKPKELLQAKAADRDEAAGGETSEARPVRDPFNAPAQVTGRTAGVVPTDLMNADLMLKGVLILEGREPSALVQIVGEETQHIVHEGDLIPLRSKQRKPSTASGAAGGVVSGMQYLLVVEISADNVIIAPEEQPENHRYLLRP